MTNKPSNEMLLEVYRGACMHRVTDHIEAACLLKDWTVVGGTASDIAKQFVDSLPDSHIYPFHDIAVKPNEFQRTKDLIAQHRVHPKVMERLLRRLRDVRMVIRDPSGAEMSVHIFESKGDIKDLVFRNNIKGGHGGITLILQSKYNPNALTGENALSVRKSTKRATDTLKSNLKGANDRLDELAILPAEEKETTKDRALRADKARKPHVQPSLFNEKTG